MSIFGLILTYRNIKKYVISSSLETKLILISVSYRTNFIMYIYDQQNWSMEYLELVKTGRNQWWAYLLGLLAIVFTVLFLGSIPLEIYFETADKSVLTEVEYYEYVLDWNFEKLGLDKNIGLFFLVCSFAIAFLVLYLVVKYLHERDFSTLINHTGKIRWNRIAFAAIVWSTLMFSDLLIDILINSDQYSLQFDFKKFIPLLLIALFWLPIQTSCEELFFRGYLLQAIGLLTKYPIIPVVATSILFALVHMWNPEVEAFGWPIMFSYYFTFAFALALLTIWDKGIEIALGVHAVNNAFGAISITYSDAVIQTDAIWNVTIKHIGWTDILIYFIFFCILIYAYYFWYIKRASGHVIRS